MFFIVNKTKQTIVLGDIKVTLGPRQAIDLDKVVGRHKSEASKDLKVARKNGVVDVRIKDGEKPKAQKDKSSQSTDLEGFKKDIVDEITGSMKDIVSGQQPQQVQAGVSEEQLERMLQRLIKAMPQPSKETVIIEKEGKILEKTEEEVEIDEDKLADINARTVDGIVKNTELKSVHYKEESQENTILDNVDELENLLFDD